MNKNDLTPEYLKSIYDYNEASGKFFWKKRTNSLSRAVIGREVGTPDRDGYKRLKLFGKIYLVHHVTWFLFNNKWPVNELDHINGVRDDNRIENLRDVSSRQNSQNQKKHRNGHLLGTYFRKDNKKWGSKIVVSKKHIHLGFFDTKELAHDAYMKKLTEIGELA